MAITFPLSASIFADKLRVESVSWRLRDNQQFSGVGSGQIIAADLAPRLWEADIQTYTLRPSCGAQVQALIEALDGAINPFYLYNPKCPRPKADPGGSSGWFPAKTWNFATDVEGWSAAGGTLSVANGVLTLNSSSGDSHIDSHETTLAVDGSKYPKLRMRVRRTTGAGPLAQLQLYFTTLVGFQSPPVAVDSPVDPSAWNVIEWDLSDDPRWTESFVTNVRIDIGTTGDVIEIDWIDIGNDTFPGECRIASVPDANSMSLAGLPVGYVLSVGDLFAFDYGSPARRALHRVCEAATADASGVTTAFTVRPHIRVGAAVGDVVNLYKPSAKMIMQPGTFQVSTSGFLATTTISFSAIQKL